MPVEGPSPLETGSVEPIDLRVASLSGVRWFSLGRLIAEVLTIGSSVVLARLIPPAEFGRAAIALGFVAIALAVAWVGFGSALVQMRSVEREDVEVATLLSITTGVAFTLTTFFLFAPYAIEPLFGARVAHLLKLASPTLFASGLGTVPTAMLQRQLEFRRLSQIEILSAVAGTAAAITLAAVVGLQAEALVLGGVTTAYVATLYVLLVAPLSRPRWRRGRSGHIASFGAFAALASVIGTLFSNIDYAILGARLSLHEVGFYWRGYQVGVEYQSKISGIVLRLAFPIFSRAASLDEMRRLRVTMLRAQTIVLYPVLTTLIALAPELVPLVFGSAWEPAVFPTQVLAVAGMATVAVAGSAQVTFAAGKPRAVLWFFIFLVAGYAAIVTWSSGYGLRTVVIAVAIYQVILAGAQFYFLESRQLGIPLRETWSGILPALAGSAISLAAAYPAERLLAEIGAPGVVVILIAGTFAVAVYAVALRIIFPASWRETIRLTRALLGRGTQARHETFDEMGAPE